LNKAMLLIWLDVMGQSVIRIETLSVAVGGKSAHLHNTNREEEPASLNPLLHHFAGLRALPEQILVVVQLFVEELVVLHSIILEHQGFVLLIQEQHTLQAVPLPVAMLPIFLVVPPVLVLLTVLFAAVRSNTSSSIDI